MLNLIIESFLINKFNSHRINEELKEFQVKNTFYGNEILYQIRNNKMDICLNFKGYTINDYKENETKQTFHQIIMSNKKNNLNNMIYCLKRLKKYVNHLLTNNTMFNSYLTKDSFLLFNTKYERSYQTKDFCLTYVPEKNNFLLLKNKDLGINCFTLIKEISEEDIFNHKEFFIIKDDIEFMLIIANKYRALIECINTLIFDSELNKEREWNNDNFTNNIDLMFQKHQVEK